MEELRPEELEELVQELGEENGAGELLLSQFGQVVSQTWERIPVHATHVELDALVVMPNHMHGIIVIASPR